MDGWAKIFLAQNKITSESARRADHWYTGIPPPPPSKRVRLGNFGGFRWTTSTAGRADWSYESDVPPACSEESMEEYFVLVCN